jgi:hypothetical protein
LGLALFFALSACDADPKGQLAADFHITDEVASKDLGLPRYAGSKPYRDDDEDSSAANIGLSTPLFGFRVVAMKLETSDRPEQVAAFYKQAMAQYGSVLECSQRNGKSSSDKEALSCDSDDAGKHKIVYKVGTEDNQRIVAIEPHGTGTRFSLVRLDMRDAK